MRVHPVMLRVDGRPAVVVGGDRAAAPKIESLLQAGAAVTVVARTLVPAIADSVASGRVRHVARDFQEGDLRGAAIAYASTTDAELIARLTTEAARERVLLNVIDVPAACDFVSPAVLRRGDLVVAVGTGGASPGLAGRLRDRLAAEIGPEYGPFVHILRTLRAALADRPDRADVISALLDSPLLGLVRDADPDGIDAVLASVAGEGTSLAALGIARPEGGAW